MFKAKSHCQSFWKLSGFFLRSISTRCCFFHRCGSKFVQTWVLPECSSPRDFDIIQRSTVLCHMCENLITPNYRAEKKKHPNNRAPIFFKRHSLPFAKNSADQIIVPLPKFGSNAWAPVQALIFCWSFPPRIPPLFSPHFPPCLVDKMSICVTHQKHQGSIWSIWVFVYCILVWFFSDGMYPSLPRGRSQSSQGFKVAWCNFLEGGLRSILVVSLGKRLYIP